MLKNIVTAAALFAASTALASADTITISPSSGDLSGGSYYGFTFSLSSTDYTNADGYTLDSLTLILRASSTTASGYFVIYSYDSSLDSLTYVGSGAVTNTKDALVIYGSNYSTNSSDMYTRAVATSSSFTDSDDETLVLYAGTSYFVAIASDLSSAEALTSFSSSVLSQIGMAAATNADESLAEVGSLINSSGTAADTSYAAVVGATLTAVSVPEPSTFGLLAGIGALALVAARRRRR